MAKLIYPNTPDSNLKVEVELTLKQAIILRAISGSVVCVLQAGEVRKEMDDLFFQLMKVLPDGKHQLSDFFFADKLVERLVDILD